eukprot:6819087-Pyramimonas_sp.AAC.1
MGPRRATGWREVRLLAAARVEAEAHDAVVLRGEVDGCRRRQVIPKDILTRIPAAEDLIHLLR